MGFTLLALLLVGAVAAQPQTGGIKGKVFNTLRDPMLGATLILEHQQSEVFVAGQVADLDGNYRFENITPGEYRLKVQYLGYLKTHYQVTVLAGRETILDIELREIEPIIGPPIVYIWSPRSTSTYLGEDVLFKSPAVYDDPGRAVALQAGVIAPNDQANHLSVRGNNPSWVKWFLEDLEIPNPNHTPNAGTANDRTTQAGGGVNILKPQFLRSTEFLNGAFQPGYGNVTGGVINTYIQENPSPTSDLSLRLGLIGTEGYLKHAPNPQRGDFLNVNARYSTVGFLTDVLGLDFGGERINYYDINASYARPLGKYGKLKLFHVSGRSTNRYTAPRDSTAWEESRDRFDIDFGATMAFTGTSYRYSRGAQLLKFSLGHAYSRSTRTGEVLLPDLSSTERIQADTLQEQRLSLYGYYHHNHFTASLRLQQQWHKVNRTDLWAGVQSGGQLQGLLAQPAFRLRVLGNEQRGLLYLGMHSMIWSDNGSQSYEPRLQWQRRIGRLAADLQLSYGLHSQQQQATTYLTQSPNGDYLNRDLGFTRAHHFNLDLQPTGNRRYRNPQKIDYRLSAYFQYLFEVPIAQGVGRSYSVLNDITPLIGEPLANEGVGRNYGVELQVQQVTETGWEWAANGAWYRSEYCGADEVWRNTRYNGQWMTNLRLGRTWGRLEHARSGTDETRQSQRGFYLRAWVAGGLWQSPIDVAASAATGVTTFVESAAYTLRDEASYRADLRLFWERKVYNRKRNFQHPVRTHTVALDIQNLTNRRNVAFTYYDPLQQAIITKRQLGLIPLLSWTVTW